jgi:hypothetical protein
MEKIEKPFSKPARRDYRPTQMGNETIFRLGFRDLGATTGINDFKAETLDFQLDYHRLESSIGTPFFPGFASRYGINRK